MNRLVGRSIEHFLKARHGSEFWAQLACQEDTSAIARVVQPLPHPNLATRLMAEAAVQLERPESDLWEDLGTHLVTHPDMETLRRLLRFGGVTFEEFLWSLDTLESRVAMAMPGLGMPQVELEFTAAREFTIKLDWPGEATIHFGYLTVGLLRAMADDYGTLVLLEGPRGAERGQTGLSDESTTNPDLSGSIEISVSILDDAFAEGRSFLLGEAGAA